MSDLSATTNTGEVPVVSRTSSLRRRANRTTAASASVEASNASTNSETNDVTASIPDDDVIPLRDDSGETAEEKAVRKAREALAEAERKATEKAAKRAEKEAAKAAKEEAKAAKKASKKEAKASKKASKKEAKAAKKEAKAAKKASKKEAKIAKKTEENEAKAAKKLDKRMTGMQARLVRTSSLGHVEAARAVSAALEAARSAEQEKVKLVIPFGCEEGLVEARVECLLHYVLRDLDIFDEVIFYQNTNDANDVAYLRALVAMLNEKFTLLTPDEVLGGEEGISALFPRLREPNTLYILAEDDTVFVAEGAFENLISYARTHRNEYTVFSGNVVNNGPIDQVHQQKGVSLRDTRISYEDSYDDLYKPDCARQVHASAMRAIKGLDGKSVDDYTSIGDHLYLDQETFALNVIAFFGDSFTDADLVGITDKGAEKYICKKMGDDNDRCAVVVGNTFFVHYSFPKQHKKKKNFDPEETILNDYRYLAGLEGDGALSILERLRS